jgi:hypothetical protein
MWHSSNVTAPVVTLMLGPCFSQLPRIAVTPALALSNSPIPKGDDWNVLIMSQIQRRWW